MGHSGGGWGRQAVSETLSIWDVINDGEKKQKGDMECKRVVILSRVVGEDVGERESL